MNWTKFLLLIVSINCLGCALPTKQFFYYSPSTYKQKGLEGFCKINNKVFPATHVLEGRLIRKDAVFLGCGEYLEQDSLNQAIWPTKQEYVTRN